MHITKFGHCCLLIEDAGARILVDPGCYSDGQNSLRDLDLILITHEHADHLDLVSLKQILAQNPDAQVLTNFSVAKILKGEGIDSTVPQDGDSLEFCGIKVEAVGASHAAFYPGLPDIPNIGFILNDRFFYPGDALTMSPHPVEILALPVAGPFLKIGEAIDYALAVGSKKCFPVHDGILKSPGLTSSLPPNVLGPKGIEFTPLELGRAYEF